MNDIIINKLICADYITSSPSVLYEMIDICADLAASNFIVLDEKTKLIESVLIIIATVIKSLYHVYIVLTFWNELFELNFNWMKTITITTTTTTT